MTEFLEGHYVVGQRVVDDDNYCGTIRYIGPVASAKKVTDVWLGVEWDKDTRGKHDGSCVTSDQVTHRYFTCRPGAGSFIKPNKINTGCTLVAALHDRYVDMNAPLLTEVDNSLSDSFIVTAKGEKKVIEFVGESVIRKHQQLQDATAVSVRNCRVSTVGGGLETLIAHVKELDLQDNLFSNWSTIAEICGQIPLLDTLLLHGNRIGDIDAEDLETLCGKFDNVKVIALNCCALKSWETVKSLNDILPQLTELYLAANSFGNGISSLSSSHFVMLCTVDLSSCGVSSWKSIADAFGELQSLEAILLDCNEIEEVESKQDGKFLKLTRISLASTRISSWSDVDALATYSSLTSLRLTNIPLFANKGASEVRPEVIARIARLLVFNGSKVGDRERMDSEKIYLRKMLRQKRVIESEESSEKEPTSFEAMHPRYVELNDKYGADLLPLGGEGPGSGLSNMASDMVSVTLHNLSFESNGSLEPISRKLPPSLKVDRLKLMVKQLFGLDTHKQLLSIRQYKGAVPTLMDEESATIGYFGAVDGADIYINED